MDSVISGFLALFQDYPVISVALTGGMVGLVYLLKKRLLILLSPQQLKGE